MMCEIQSETVSDVLDRLIRDPLHNLILKWNWKSALTSALIRAWIFFAANLTAGFGAAFLALGVEFVFRIIVSGFYGAITQAFRNATPAWKASIIAMILLPLLGHSIEFVVHWSWGTPCLATSILSSIIFTALSTLFNLYVMRRGILIVGAGARSLWADLRELPMAMIDFVLIVPRTFLGKSRQEKPKDSNCKTECTITQICR